MPNGDFFDSSFDTPNANGTGSRKLLPKLEALAKSIGDFVDTQRDSKKIWAKLLNDEVVVFHVKALDHSKLKANSTDPFNRVNDFFLQYSPEDGFFVACEFKGQPLATAFSVSNDGRILDYNDQVRITNRRVVMVPSRLFTVKAAEPGEDAKACALQEAGKLVSKLIRLGVPENEVDKSDPPGLG